MMPQFDSKADSSSVDVEKSNRLHFAKSSVPEARFPEISQLVFGSANRIWTTTLVGFLAAVSLGAGAFVLVPANYLGTSYVRILQREGYLLTNQQTRAEDLAFVRSQVSLVTQDQSLALALQDEQLNRSVMDLKIEDPISWLKSQIKAEISSGSDTMTILASSLSLPIAEQVSRAVTNAYLHSVDDQMRIIRERRIQELEKTAMDVNEKLMHQWNLLQSKATVAGSANPQSLLVNEQIKIQNMRDNSHRLRTLEFQRSQLEVQLANTKLQRINLPVPSEELVRAAIDIHPEILSLREQVRQSELKIQKMQELVQSKNAPQLVRLQNERDYYCSALTQAEAKVESAERIRLKSTAPVPAQSTKVKEWEDQVKLLSLEISHLRETSSQIEEKIEVASGSSSIELEIIRHEIDRHEKLADQVWKTIQELRIEERAEPRVSLISHPDGTVRLNRSKQWKATVSACLIGCLFGVLVVGYFELASCLVRTPSDIIERTGMKVFGFSSLSRQARPFDLSGRPKAKSVGEGAEDITAQLLLQADSNGRTPVLFVSSTSSHAPRGLVAVAIAKALVQAGQKTLVVACEPFDELRIADQITGTPSNSLLASWSDQICHSLSFGFDCLRIQDFQEQHSWTLSKTLSSLLSELKKHYTSIVVVGPAVLTNPEAILLSKQTDSVLLVGEIGLTRSNELSAARELLESANADILGALITNPTASAKLDAALRAVVATEQKSTSNSRDDESELLIELDGLRGQMLQRSQPVPIQPPHHSNIANRTHSHSNQRTSE